MYAFHSNINNQKRKHFLTSALFNPCDLFLSTIPPPLFFFLFIVLIFPPLLSLSLFRYPFSFSVSSEISLILFMPEFLFICIYLYMKLNVEDRIDVYWFMFVNSFFIEYHIKICITIGILQCLVHYST